jgi:hypothetical protein
MRGEKPSLYFKYAAEYYNNGIKLGKPIIFEDVYPYTGGFLAWK